MMKFKFLAIKVMEIIQAQKICTQGDWFQG